MYSSKAPDPKFVNGVDSFVKTARAFCINRLQDDDHVYCPCVDCGNQHMGSTHGHHPVTY